MNDVAKRPLILVTNDDGIEADGINILADALQRIARVVVVAPAQEQSAVGHGISLSRPMRLASPAPDRHAVTGSPADSVLVGLHMVCKEEPSLVVSGINHGLNLGTDVFYSGTIAGALEGVIHGIPGLAVSQEVTSGDGPDRELMARTARFAVAVAQQILADPPPAGVAVSLNAPAVPTERFVWTRLGRRVYREKVERRLDLRGIPYYWVGGPAVRGADGPGTDSHAVESGLMSLTPLTLNLTGDVPPCYHDWEFAPYMAGTPDDSVQ